jgi:hypothetical protein
MSHSLIGADRRTHCKIVAVALSTALGLVALSAAAWRTDSGAAAVHAQGPALKAGKPTISANTGSRVIR